MNFRKIIIISALISVGLFSTWYFDVWNEPVETIDELIGKNYDYAHKVYFQSDPVENYTININDILNEFDGGVYHKKTSLTDSIIEVYTWNLFNLKKTIWVGNTRKGENIVIDAISYKDELEF